jgi:sarcosine oxidase, subunit delta
MLLIPCPWCGPRPEPEFSGGTDTTRIRPTDEAFDDDAAWAAYLFHSANEPGERQERWCHTHGCGQWFLLSRDCDTGMPGKASRLAPPPPRPEASPPPPAGVPLDMATEAEPAPPAAKTAPESGDGGKT